MQTNSEAKPDKKQLPKSKCATCKEAKVKCGHCMGVPDGNGGTKYWAPDCKQNRGGDGVRCICCKRRGDADRQAISKANAKGKCSIAPAVIDVVSAIPIARGWQQVDSITDQHSPPPASEDSVTATAAADKFGPDLRSLVQHANSLKLCFAGNRLRSAESTTVTQGRLLSLEALAVHLQSECPSTPAVQVAFLLRHSLPQA
jgi:hypothetical protein